MHLTKCDNILFMISKPSKSASLYIEFWFIIFHCNNDENSNIKKGCTQYVGNNLYRFWSNLSVFLRLSTLFNELHMGRIVTYLPYPKNYTIRKYWSEERKDQTKLTRWCKPKKYITFTLNISQGKKKKKLCIWRTTQGRFWKRWTLLNTIQAIVLTLSRESTRQIVAVVHIDSARASSAAANFALTFY